MSEQHILIVKKKKKSYMSSDSRTEWLDVQNILIVEKQLQEWLLKK